MSPGLRERTVVSTLARTGLAILNDKALADRPEFALETRFWPQRNNRIASGNKHAARTSVDKNIRDDCAPRCIAKLWHAEDHDCACTACTQPPHFRRAGTGCTVEYRHKRSADASVLLITDPPHSASLLPLGYYHL